MLTHTPKIALLHDTTLLRTLLLLLI